MKTCSLCNKANLEEYVDGATTFGPWADMCMECFGKKGQGLGIGRGQHYQHNGKHYVQVAGGTQKGRAF